MYTKHELQDLRRAIYENAADQMLWQVLYINSVAQHSPNLNVIRNKLLSLPKTFELIMHNSIHSPIVKDLTKAVFEGNRLFVQYIDSVFRGRRDSSIIKHKLDDNIQYIAKCLHEINPQWGITEWLTLINHQIDLMNTVIDDAKKGNYNTWEQVLPIILKLKMDMADYLANGIR